MADIYARIDAITAMANGLLTAAQQLRQEVRDDQYAREGDPLEVVGCVALRLGSTVADILAKHRYRGTVRARHAAAAALHSCGLSYSEIGRVLKLDHTTVMHAVHQAAQRSKDEPAFAAAVQAGIEVWRRRRENVNALERGTAVYASAGGY